MKNILSLMLSSNHKILTFLYMKKLPWWRKLCNLRKFFHLFIFYFKVLQLLLVHLCHWIIHLFGICFLYISYLYRIYLYTYIYISKEEVSLTVQQFRLYLFLSEKNMTYHKQTGTFPFVFECHRDCTEYLLMRMNLNSIFKISFRIPDKAMHSIYYLNFLAVNESLIASFCVHNDQWMYFLFQNAL